MEIEIADIDMSTAQELVQAPPISPNQCFAGRSLTIIASLAVRHFVTFTRSLA